MTTCSKRHLLAIRTIHQATDKLRVSHNFFLNPTHFSHTAVLWSYSQQTVYFVEFIAPYTVQKVAKPSQWGCRAGEHGCLGYEATSTLVYWDKACGSGWKHRTPDLWMDIWLSCLMTAWFKTRSWKPLKHPLTQPVTNQICFLIFFFKFIESIKTWGLQLINKEVLCKQVIYIRISLPLVPPDGSQR